MLLTPEGSLCKKNQSIVVSKDKGAQREHRADNSKKNFDLRHYRLDGLLIKQSKCCDYLLVNDSNKEAYFIELKGGKIDDAIDQLKAGREKCEAELQGYSFFYRIVCSKAKTHKIRSPKVRMFQEQYKKQLKIKENQLIDILD